VEDDREIANNQVELYFSQATPSSLLDISTDILSTSSHKWRYISLAELTLKRFLAYIFFLVNVLNKKGSACMKSRLLQVSTSFIMPIAYVPYFTMDNT